jgi:RNA polymerase-binding transcription factor
MNVEYYRQRLLNEEKELAARLGREIETARDERDDQPDAGDLARVDELKDEYFTVAEKESAILTEVRAALERIDAGTFGKCIVCGAPIEEKRREAAPWTPFCRKHQEEIERRQQLRTPTL